MNRSGESFIKRKISQACKHPTNNSLNLTRLDFFSIRWSSYAWKYFSRSQRSHIRILLGLCVSVLDWKYKAMRKASGQPWVLPRRWRCTVFPSLQSLQKGGSHSTLLRISRVYQRSASGGGGGGGGRRPLALRLKPQRGHDAERTESKVRRVPHTPQKRKSRACHCHDAMAVACLVAPPSRLVLCRRRRHHLKRQKHSAYEAPRSAGRRLI